MGRLPSRSVSSKNLGEPSPSGQSETIGFAPPGGLGNHRCACGRSTHGSDHHGADRHHRRLSAEYGRRHELHGRGTDRQHRLRPARHPQPRRHDRCRTTHLRDVRQLLPTPTTKWSRAPRRQAERSTLRAATHLLGRHAAHRRRQHQPRQPTSPANALAHTPSLLGARDRTSDSLQFNVPSGPFPAKSATERLAYCRRRAPQHQAIRAGFLADRQRAEETRDSDQNCSFGRREIELESVGRHVA